MITFNAKNNETLKFRVAVAHADIKDLTGRFVVIANDIEYGFTASIKGDEITVRVPALQNVIQNLVNGQKLECKLEIIANDIFLIPYKDKILIKIPVEIKTELKNHKANETTIHLDKIDELISEQRIKNLAREIDDNIRFNLRRRKKY